MRIVRAVLIAWVLLIFVPLSFGQEKVAALVEHYVEPPQWGFLGQARVNVAVEAGIRQGWDAIIGSAGAFVGMTGFGASAPYKDLYPRFGITAEAVAEAALSRLR